MNKSVSESFQDYSRREQRELDSKQKLTELLDTQIDLNEELRLENETLVQNQRKLLYLLDARDQVIARFQQAKPKDDNHNNSTFQQTRLLRDDRHLQSSPTHRNPQTDEMNKERIHKIESQLQSMRQTYEATKAANQSLQNRLDSLTTVIKQKDLEIDKAKQYNTEAFEQMEQQHETDTRQMLRLKEKLYSLTVQVEKSKKELASKDEETHDKYLSTQRKLQERDLQLEGAKAELEELRRSKEKLQREIENLNQEISFQKRTQNDRVEQLEETLADNLGKIRESYQIINRYEQQIGTLKADIENKSYECSQLSERLDAAELRAKNMEEQCMKDNGNIEELKTAVNSIKKELDNQIRNNNNLRKQLIEMQKQARAKEEQPILEHGKIEELHLTIEQLTLKLERSKEQTDKINEKNQRENERKDKHIVQLKKIVRTVEAERDEHLVNIEQLQSKLANIQDGYSNKERRLKDELGKVQEDNERVRSESRSLKKELENMDGRVRSCLSNLQEKNTKLQNQLYSSSQQLRVLQTDNDHLKKLYEKSELELSDFKESMDAKQREVQALKRKIAELQAELRNCNNHILELQNDTQAHEHITKLQKELTDAKARILSATEAKDKLKVQNSELVKQTISLNEQKTSVSSDLEKFKAQIKSLKQEKANNDAKMAQLQRVLEQKTTQLEKSSPYLSQLVEQKKLLQLQVTKMSNQIKTYHHLLEVAKKTKADQIIALNKQVATYKKSQSRWEAEIKQANKTIQNHNREKVNMLRENTVRQDQYIKLQKDNKMFVEEIKNLQKIIEQYESHLEVAYKILNDANDRVEKYQTHDKERQRDNKSVAEVQSSKLDLSPIRSSSNRTFIAPSEPIPARGAASSASNPRSSIQQRIQAYRQDFLGIQ